MPMHPPNGAGGVRVMPSGENPPTPRAGVAGVTASAPTDANELSEVGMVAASAAESDRGPAKDPEADGALLMLSDEDGSIMDLAADLDTLRLAKQRLREALRS
jgi:hypothetical protein